VAFPFQQKRRLRKNRLARQQRRAKEFPLFANPSMVPQPGAEKANQQAGLEQARTLSSPAETLHVFRIVGQIFGQALHRPGKVARQVVTRDFAGRRLLVQTLFKAFPHNPGFRHPPRLGLSTKLSEEIIGQLH